MNISLLGFLWITSILNTTFDLHFSHSFFDAFLETFFLLVINLWNQTMFFNFFAVFALVVTALPVFSLPVPP